MKKLIMSIIIMIFLATSVMAEFNLPTLWIYNQQNGSSIDQNGNGIPDLADGVVGGGGGNITGAYGPYLFIDGTQVNFDESVLNATIQAKVIAGGGDNASWNQALADTLYAPIGAAGGNLTFNQTLTDSLYASIIWGYNQTSLALDYVAANYYTQSTLDGIFGDIYTKSDVNTIISNQNNLSIQQISSNIGNWSADKSSYYTLTSVNNIIAAQNNVSLVTINGLISANGNWSADKGSYYTVSQVNTNINNNVSVLNANNTAQLNLINQNYLNSLDLDQQHWKNSTDGYIYWDALNDWMAFNTSKIETTYYNATNISVIRGTAVGTIADIQAYNGNSYNITEVSGAPGLDFRINFTGVGSFNTILFRYKNTAGESHIMRIQLWDYDTSTWENYGSEGAVAEFGIFTFPVLDQTSHIQNGIAQMRFYSADNGNTGHTHYFDLITLSSGIPSTSGTESDPLSIYKDGTIPLTGNWNVGGTYSIYNANMINASAFYIGTSPVYSSTSVNNLIAAQNNLSLSQISANIGNWSADKSSYYTLTSVNSIIAAQNNLSIQQISSNIGNWSADKSSYTTTGNDASYVAVTGDIMTGNLNISSNNVTSVDCIVGKTGGKVCFV